MQYCNGGDSGPVVGQLSSVELSPSLAVQGESLNYGQIGQGLSVTGYDCKGSVVSTSGTIYATTAPSFADINPTTGQTCGGTWNRHLSGGIADYTLCTAPAAGGLAYVTGTVDGITSNTVPVYVHATVTGIVFGQSSNLAYSTQALKCANDPDTTCCPADPNSLPQGTTTIYDGLSCVSQTQVRQIAARVYINNDPGNLSTSGANNITCSAGHLSFGAQTGSVVTLDQNGIATAVLPGATAITAALANSSSSSSIGFFSTCPPKTIAITPVGQSTSTSINVPINNSQPFTTTVTDTLGNPITGLTLTFPSSNLQVVPLSSGTVVPNFPGTATVTALCQPPSCNPAPADQLGLNGNGKTITSNGVQITASGSSSTQIYVGSTGSRYILPYDFSNGLPGTIIQLQYAPNSMVISTDGSVVYFGSQYGLMTMSTASNLATSANTLIPGQVISLSPDGTTLIVTDPTRQTTSLVTGGSTVASTYGGIATHASWSADSSTVYITTSTTSTDTNAGYVLNHSNNSLWQKTAINAPAGTTTSGNTYASKDTYYTDVAAMVPSVGAYFAGATSTDGRSYCPTTTLGTITTNVTPVETNVFMPMSDTKPVITDRIIATGDTKHVIGANSTASAATPYLTDLVLNNAAGSSAAGVCTANTNNTTHVEPPVNFTSTQHTFNFAGVTPTSITGIVPSSNSAVAFVTFLGTGNGKVPYYLPNITTPALNYLTLSTALGTPTAPTAGVFSTDNSTFYLTTAGDLAIHQITVTYPTSGSPVVTETTAPLAPQLPLATGASGYATPNLIVQRPRKITS